MRRVEIFGKAKYLDGVNGSEINSHQQQKMCLRSPLTDSPVFIAFKNKRREYLLNSRCMDKWG